MFFPILLGSYAYLCAAHLFFPETVISNIETQFTRTGSETIIIPPVVSSIPAIALGFGLFIGSIILYFLLKKLNANSDLPELPVSNELISTTLSRSSSSSSVHSLDSAVSDTSVPTFKTDCDTLGLLAKKSIAALEHAERLRVPASDNLQRLVNALSDLSTYFPLTEAQKAALCNTKPLSLDSWDSVLATMNKFAHTSQVMLDSYVGINFPHFALFINDQLVVYNRLLTLQSTYPELNSTFVEKVLPTANALGCHCAVYVQNQSLWKIFAAGL